MTAFNVAFRKREVHRSATFLARGTSVVEEGTPVVREPSLLQDMLHQLTGYRKEVSDLLFHYSEYWTLPES